MTLMKLRLDFFSTDLSQHFGMYLAVFALKFFIHLRKVRGNLKAKVIQLPNIKPEIFKI